MCVVLQKAPRYRPEAKPPACPGKAGDPPGFPCGTGKAPDRVAGTLGLSLGPANVTRFGSVKL